MKDFLSEYGFAILAAIVVILLIAMCTPVGNLIKNQVLGVVDSFAGKTEAKLAAIDDDGAIKVVIEEVDTKGNYKVVATTNSTTDALKAQFRIKDQHGNWGDWKDATGTLSTGKMAHEIASEATGAKDGESVQFRVCDPGKDANMYYESNIVVNRLGA